MSRLFLGTFLPDEVKARITVVQGKNRELDARWRCKSRWVQPAKLHLTWLFLGEVDPARLAELEQTMASLKSRLLSPGELVYDRLEVWFGRGMPRHLVLVPTHISSQFIEVVTAVRAKLIEFVADDYRQQAKDQLKPHVTLMRFQKLEGESPRLPLVSSTSAPHPFVDRKKLRIKELSAEAIEGMVNVLPIHQAINRVDIISSNQEGSSHGYSVVKSFPLS